MVAENAQYLSLSKKQALEAELKNLREEKIPAIAKRIDDARQLGDLSENAEYHAAREEMAWAQSRVHELEYILENSVLIEEHQTGDGSIKIGSLVKVMFNGKEKEFSIVGAQEASPLQGKISNESPIGQALLGKRKGDVVEITVPSGIQKYEVLSIQ